MLHASTRAHSQASSALAQSSRRVRKRFSTTSVVRRPASAPKDGPSEAKASDPPSESSSAPRPPSSSSPSPSASTPSSASSTPSASTSCLFRPASLASSSSHGSSSSSSSAASPSPRPGAVGGPSLTPRRPVFTLSVERGAALVFPPDDPLDLLVASDTQLSKSEIKVRKPPLASRQPSPPSILSSASRVPLNEGKERELLVESSLDQVVVSGDPERAEVGGGRTKRKPELDQEGSSPLTADEVVWASLLEGSGQGSELSDEWEALLSSSSSATRTQGMKKTTRLTRSPVPPSRPRFQEQRLGFSPHILPPSPSSWDRDARTMLVLVDRALPVLPSFLDATPPEIVVGPASLRSTSASKSIAAKPKFLPPPRPPSPFLPPTPSFDSAPEQPPPPPPTAQALKRPSSASLPPRTQSAAFSSPAPLPIFFAAPIEHESATKVKKEKTAASPPARPLARRATKMSSGPLDLSSLLRQDPPSRSPNDPLLNWSVAPALPSVDASKEASPRKGGSLSPGKTASPSSLASLLGLEVVESELSRTRKADASAASTPLLTPLTAEVTPPFPPTPRPSALQLDFTPSLPSQPISPLPQLRKRKNATPFESSSSKLIQRPSPPPSPSSPQVMMELSVSLGSLLGRSEVGPSRPSGFDAWAVTPLPSPSSRPRRSSSHSPILPPHLSVPAPPALPPTSTNPSSSSGFLSSAKPSAPASSPSSISVSASSPSNTPTALSGLLGGSTQAPPSFARPPPPPRLSASLFTSPSALCELFGSAALVSAPPPPSPSSPVPAAPPSTTPSALSGLFAGWAALPSSTTPPSTDPATKRRVKSPSRPQQKAGAPPPSPSKEAKRDKPLSEPKTLARPRHLLASPAKPPASPPARAPVRPPTLFHPPRLSTSAIPSASSNLIPPPTSLLANDVQSHELVDFLIPPPSLEYSVPTYTRTLSLSHDREKLVLRPTVFANLEDKEWSPGMRGLMHFKYFEPKTPKFFDLGSDERFPLTAERRKGGLWGVEPSRVVEIEEEVDALEDGGGEQKEREPTWFELVGLPDVLKQERELRKELKAAEPVQEPTLPSSPTLLPPPPPPRFPLSTAPRAPPTLPHLPPSELIKHLTTLPPELPPTPLSPTQAYFLSAQPPSRTERAGGIKAFEAKLEELLLEAASRKVQVKTLSELVALAKDVWDLKVVMAMMALAESQGGKSHRELAGTFLERSLALGAELLVVVLASAPEIYGISPSALFASSPTSRYELLDKIIRSSRPSTSDSDRSSLPSPPLLTALQWSLPVLQRALPPHPVVAALAIQAYASLGEIGALLALEAEHEARLAWKNGWSFSPSKDLPARQREWSLVVVAVLKRGNRELLPYWRAWLPKTEDPVVQREAVRKECERLDGLNVPPPAFIDRAMDIVSTEFPNDPLLTLYHLHLLALSPPSDQRSTSIETVLGKADALTNQWETEDAKVELVTPEQRRARSELAEQVKQSLDAVERVFGVRLDLWAALEVDTTVECEVWIGSEARRKRGAAASGGSGRVGGRAVLGSWDWGGVGRQVRIGSGLAGRG